MKNSRMDLCRGPLLPNIILYTLPIIASSFLQLLFNSADLVIVGQFGSTPNAVGAIGSTTSIIHLITNLFIGLSVGVSVSIAYGIGAGDHEGVHHNVHTAIPLAILLGAFVTAVGIGFAKTFLTWMATPEPIFDDAALYMQIYFSGSIFTLIYNFGAAALRASGDTKGPLIYLTLAGIANVILNIIFVVAFKLDVAGVALATVISQAISAILVLWALSKADNACRFHFSEMRLYGKQIKNILSIGLPAGIQSTLFSISNVMLQSSVNGLAATSGVDLMDGAAACGNLEGFVYVGMNSFQQTVMNFGGQNLGAGNYKRVRHACRWCLLCAGFIGLLLGGLCYAFYQPLMGIYIPGREAAIEFGRQRMLVTTVPYFLCGIMDVMTGQLRAIGLSKIPMVVCIVGICVFRIAWINTAFRLPVLHNLTGLFISYPVSWTLTFIASAIVYLIVSPKILKKTE